MLNSKIGEIVALGTAVSWTAGAMIFESATRRVGVLAVNTLKVIFGTLYLAILASILYRHFIPAGLPLNCWLFMSASGIMGMVIGDYFLFNTYWMVGSRMGMLLMSASVPMTAIASYFIFGESLGNWCVLGIFLTMSGITLTVLAGNKSALFQNSQVPKDVKETEKLDFCPKHYWTGIIFGLFSAVAMTGGTLLTKVGSVGVPAIAATQVRIFAAMVGFILLTIIGGKSAEVINAARDLKSFQLIAIGSIFGPFIGVACLLYALQKAPAGIVATITALTPVLIILPSILIWKRKVSFLEILGTAIAFVGITLLFI